MNNNKFTIEDFHKSLSDSIQQILINTNYENIRFYGYILLSIQKEFSNKIPTACLGLFNNHYKMLINPDFWVDNININKKQRIGLLVHEINE